MNKYYIINKPFGVLSQFTPEAGNRCLADIYHVEKDVYPVGRLDKDSEGLLLLTNDKKLNQLILNPKSKKEKTYWVQVDKEVTDEAIVQLENGVDIKLKKEIYRTRPAKAKRIDTPLLWERNPPVRFRKNVPTSWLEIKIKEGKNRQIRKMCATVGFPVLRLVRMAIADLQLNDLKNGDICAFSQKEIYQMLKLK